MSLDTTGRNNGLDVRDLVKVYGRRGANPAHTAVAGISFGVAPGSTTALVGESGSGKSTVARCVVGLLSPTAGSVCIAGRDVWRLSRREQRVLRRHTQIVFQDPSQSLNPWMTVRALIAEPLVIHRIGTDEERKQRTSELIEWVGLGSEHLGRRPSALSGGQRQRVAIARALACEPEILVLDEALSGLDLSVQASIVNLLLDLQARLQIAYLFIGHDLGVVRHLADDVVVMRRGEVVEQGPVERVLDSPAEHYTLQLIAAQDGRLA